MEAGASVFDRAVRIQSATVEHVATSRDACFKARWHWSVTVCLSFFDSSNYRSGRALNCIDACPGWCRPDCGAVLGIGAMGVDLQILAARVCCCQFQLYRRYMNSMCDQ